MRRPTSPLAALLLIACTSGAWACSGLLETSGSGPTDASDRSEPPPGSGRDDGATTDVTTDDVASGDGATGPDVHVTDAMSMEGGRVEAMPVADALEGATCPAVYSYDAGSYPSSSGGSGGSSGGYDDAGVLDSGPPWGGGPACPFVQGVTPFYMAADAEYLYWTSFDGLSACPLSGCGAAPTLLASAAQMSSELEPIMAQGGSVYFVSATDDVAVCAGSGCASPPSTYETVWAGVPEGGFVSFEFASDSSNLYFTNGRDLLFSCGLGKKCGKDSTVADATPSLVGPVAVSSTEIFYYLYAGPSMTDGGFSGDIVATPKTGGTTRVVCAAPYLTSMAVAGSYVYFSGGSSIEACPIAGGGPETFFDFGRSVQAAVATDATNVFWTVYEGPGTVGTCAAGPTCSSPQTVAYGNYSSVPVVTASAVYWESEGDIMWAPKK